MLRKATGRKKKKRVTPSDLGSGKVGVSAVLHDRILTRVVFQKGEVHYLIKRVIILPSL